MRLNLLFACVLGFAPLIGAPCSATREPALKQVDVPDDYYWREMYVPQLTNGPSSLAWSPDGKSLVYSMAGSLWRQGADGGHPVQITAGPGYDYQPDWSPDGKSVVFARYHEDAIELWALDLTSGRTKRLTHNRAVNLEPRISPDGRTIAFVSTYDTGHFHIFTVGLDGATDPVRLFPEARTIPDRYYYGPFDQEISPSWSPDGTQLLYVSDSDAHYGTGSLWRRAVTGGPPLLVQKEESSWGARPDWARDGKRVVWSSYTGRQRLQLWITSVAAGGDPLPLTFGDFDITSARWSPDGRRIAFVSNETGDGAIRIMDVPGGLMRTVTTDDPRYLKPMGTLDLQVVDETGTEVAARVAITGSDGRAYAAPGTWMHGNYSFDRAQRSEEEHYFHSSGHAALKLPAGTAQIEIWRGPTFRVEHRSIDIVEGSARQVTVQLHSILPPALQQWVGGDVHVHMNYGGHYRNTPTELARQAAAEDLGVAFNLIVNLQQRVPDISSFLPVPDPASTATSLIVPAQEFHGPFWGHLALIGLTDHLLLPDVSAYDNTGLASVYPDDVAIARLAHEQDALVGYVHPFDADADPKASSTHEIPVAAALGQIDYYETVGFSDHLVSSAIWYRLLNLGFRIAAAGGTDAMANYASLHGPVGLDRTYVLPDKRAGDPVGRRDAWLSALKAGHSFATNGPLLSFTVGDRLPGDALFLPSHGGKLAWHAEMASIGPVDHLEVVRNGKVISTIRLSQDGRHGTGSGTINVRTSGWILLRAWSWHDVPEILDTYPYATTTPVYLTVEGAPQHAAEDARYMLDWLETIEKAAVPAIYSDDGERKEILKNIAEAKHVYELKK